LIAHGAERFLPSKRFTTPSFSPYAFATIRYTAPRHYAADYYDAAAAFAFFALMSRERDAEAILRRLLMSPAL